MITQRARASTTILSRASVTQRVRGRRSWWRGFLAQRDIHILILPALILVIIFQYIPMYGILIAFKNYDVFEGVFGSPWANNNGFGHFIDFIRGRNLLPILRNTIALSVLKLAFLSFPPVLFALFLNEIINRFFKRLTQTISYLPHFTPWVVLGGIMFLMFVSTRDSPVNLVLLALGIVDKPTDVINNPNSIWAVFVLSELWKEVGWHSIIYLAVMASIDPNLYEAAELDGAGRFTKMVHISWPALKGTFMIMFILSCGSLMSGMGASFDQSYILGTASNKSMSQILDVYILRVGLEQARYSFATAVGMLQSIANLILLVSANRLSRRLTGKGLF